MKGIPALSAEQLASVCNPDELTFESTDEIILGQARALEAIRFGLAARRPGYSLFAGCQWPCHALGGHAPA